MPAVENINGQAITLAIKHKDKRDPKSWKGFKFAVPFDYSMHNYLLRYYVAEHGIDPDTGHPDPRGAAAGNGGEPARRQHRRLSRRPIRSTSARSTTASASSTCCRRTSGTAIPAAPSRRPRSSSPRSPNTYAALLKAIIDATAFAHKPENRKQIAEAIAPANYLNQPVTVVEQVLTGTFADGLGNVKRDPDRIDFDPFPWQSFAIWILTQMKRWGQIKGDVDYKAVAEQVFLATDTAKLMKEVGLTPPTRPARRSFAVMGKEFDPAKPEDYVKSFAIKRV